MGRVISREAVSDQFISKQQSRQMGDAYAAAKSRKRSTRLSTGEEEHVDGVDVQTEIENNKSKRLVEFSIVGPLIPPHGLVDDVRNDHSVVVCTDETIPEGCIYKVSFHESCDALSPSTEAVTQLLRVFNRRATNGIFQTSLLTTHQSKDLNMWLILFSAQMSPKPNGYKMIMISGSKYHMITAFTLVLRKLACSWAISKWR